MGAWVDDKVLGQEKLEFKHPPSASVARTGTIVWIELDSDSAIANYPIPYITMKAYTYWQ